MWTMRSQRRSPRSGLVVATAAVAATTALIFVLRPHVPVLSTGVLYLLGVLLVSSVWGLWLGLLTSVASALAFNFAHIPPTGGFTISDPANWLGLVVYLVAAVVVSAIADQARARTEEAELRGREASLAAELALLVLGPEESALERAAARIGEAVGASEVQLVEGWVDGGPKQRAFPLLVGRDRVGTLLVGRDAPTTAVERITPALGALLDARRRRTELDEQQIETEALRRSDALKTALLRAVSHDLRSPLTAVRAAAGAVDSPTVDDEQRRELADVIRAETDRLTDLVQGLLDLSRLESGTAEPRREPCSLEEVVDASMTSAGLPEAVIKVRLPEDLPAVLVDAAQLERVVSNLLTNAVRYGSNGSPVVVTADRAGERVHLRIRDQGSGIATQDLTRIFEPFYRGGDAQGHGSGLGLAIAKGFVEGNGGRLWAQSEPDEGSTFTVDLPVAL
jgi:two-component system, OmpR family, sensor histidine kinase KdpD